MLKTKYFQQSTTHTLSFSKNKPRSQGNNYGTPVDYILATLARRSKISSRLHRLTAAVRDFNIFSVVTPPAPRSTLLNVEIQVLSTKYYSYPVIFRKKTRSQGNNYGTPVDYILATLARRSKISSRLHRLTAAVRDFNIFSVVTPPAPRSTLLNVEI